MSASTLRSRRICAGTRRVDAAHQIAIGRSVARLDRRTKGRFGRARYSEPARRRPSVRGARHPGSGRAQPLAPARTARDRISAGVPALPRQRGARRRRPLALHHAARFLAGGTHEIWVQGTSVSRATRCTTASAGPRLLGRLQNFWQLSRSTYGQLGFTGAGRRHTGDTISGAGFRPRLPAHLASAECRHPAGHDLPRRGVPAPRRPRLGVTTDRYGTFAGHQLQG